MLCTYTCDVYNSRTYVRNGYYSPYILWHSLYNDGMHFNVFYALTVLKYDSFWKQFKFLSNRPPTQCIKIFNNISINAVFRVSTKMQKLQNNVSSGKV